MLVPPNLGLFTLPLSFVGLAITCVPIQYPGDLALGVQNLGAPPKKH